MFKAINIMQSLTISDFKYISLVMYKWGLIT
jgi:hypothetical protein